MIHREGVLDASAVLGMALLATSDVPMTITMKTSSWVLPRFNPLTLGITQWLLYHPTPLMSFHNVDW